MADLAGDGEGEEGMVPGMVEADSEVEEESDEDSDDEDITNGWKARRDSR